ncbi:MAG TPA: R3H domain-containing nucleic acid-binding protein [Candidatus Paceibacterota bacterium]
MNIISEHKEDITGVVRKITGYMNLECQVELKENEYDSTPSLAVSVYAPENARFLIGKNGQNLQAFEHVVKAILTKKTKQTLPVILDVNDYRKSRATYLIDVAKHAVTRVRTTQKAEALVPMPSHERRIVHMELAAYPDITTESIGNEPQRRIVIKPL